MSYREFILASKGEGINVHIGLVELDNDRAFLRFVQGHQMVEPGLIDRDLPVRIKIFGLIGLIG